MIMKKHTAKKFQDLIVWQKAHAFVLGVYRLTQNFPKQEYLPVSRLLGVDWSS